METLTVRELISQVERGQIRIPAFQRGFVWEPDRVAFLMDSIFKSYPYGALLFWRTSETLTVERALGPFTLPDPQADYPIDYVLDGQQRVTSIYAAFQTTVAVDESEEWKEIYFDYSVADDAQETQFFALSSDEVDLKKHFPMRVLFDTTEYRKATKGFGDDLATKIDEMQAAFKEARIPVQIFRTEERGQVAVIFERINRQGVPLDTMQLLAAWTWSEDFQLQEQFQDLADELDGFGYSTGYVDENLLLRCASAVLVGEPKPESIIEIKGEIVRQRFDEVISGVQGALDFLRKNLHIQRIDNLPFQTILVPLSVFFAVSGNKEVLVNDSQRQQIVRWFWRACFARRYSSGVLRHIKEDITYMLQLKGGQKSSLGSFTSNVDRAFYISNKFGIRNVNTKTFILQLAQLDPKSFHSGSNIDLDRSLREYNKTEFHHLMPKSYVSGLKVTQYSVNCIANFCFLSRADNRHLGGDKPSVYRAKLPKDHLDVLLAALCPETLFDDEFDSFVEERADALVSNAKKLIENTKQGIEPDSL